LELNWTIVAEVFGDLLGSSAHLRVWEVFGEEHVR